MIRFAQLYNAIDSTTKTSEKIAAMSAYFGAVEPLDAAWAIYFLAGNKLRQLVPTKLLRQWAAEVADVPTWLFDESYHAVGDLAETLSLVVPAGQLIDELSLAQWITDRLLPLRDLDGADQRSAVLDIWEQTPADVRFVVMKLITGSFRVGVSKRLVTRAIADRFGVPADTVAHRLMGDCQPSTEFFQQLISVDTHDTLISQPYPFCLAHAIDNQAGPALLGQPQEYRAEWKWDGIRGQLIRRENQTFLWSRGEELMENRWPEIEAAAAEVPNGTVLDGEILASLGDGSILPFTALQRRIGRKKVGKKLLAEIPVVFHVFDLLEVGGHDIRTLPFDMRRQRLEELLGTLEHPHLRLTQLLSGSSWDQWRELRQSSRERNAEGLMLKRKDAPYDVGRVRGTWWKWKIDPHTIDAVLIYAQKGHGKRASLYSDYTFGLWNEGKLVPFAKAYSGLTDAEIRQVDQFVRNNTREAFGPVRSVTPQLVMELAFEGLQRSTRHKSGIATRFPRIVRWRHDKKPDQANRLSDLLEWLPDE